MMTHSFLSTLVPALATTSVDSLPRIPEWLGRRVMAPSVSERSQSVKDLIFIGVGNLLGWMDILNVLEC